MEVFCPMKRLIIMLLVVLSLLLTLFPAGSTIAEEAEEDPVTEEYSEDAEEDEDAEDPEDAEDAEADESSSEVPEESETADTSSESVSGEKLEQASDEPQLSAEGLKKLPMDDYKAYGPAPDESCFKEGKHIYSNKNSFDDCSYVDQSIAVYVWREWRDNCCFNVARIKIADPSQLRTALERDSIKLNNYVWKIAKPKNAVIACGGEFLAHKRNKGAYCIRMGVKLRDNKGIKSHDALIIDQNGNFHATKGFSVEQLEKLQKKGITPINVFNFGPILVVDGKSQFKKGERIQYANTNPNGPHPRTGIGQLGPLEYLMVVTEGRKVMSPLPNGKKKQNIGCTIAEFADFMASYNCTLAYNLDGGNSTAMYFHGEAFSNSIKRGVTDIVYFATLVDSGKK